MNQEQNSSIIRYVSDTSDRKWMVNMFFREDFQTERMTTFNTYVAYPTMMEAVAYIRRSVVSNEDSLHSIFAQTHTKLALEPGQISVAVISDIFSDEAVLMAWLSVAP